jgi:5-methylthioadenosine/S-adenosylhomocysteine deaminase
MKIALTPSAAVTCNENFDVLENPVIHIEDNIISYIGESHYAPPFEANETFGGEHIIAMPGLINTHTHAAMTLVRGYADDMALEPWLSEKIWPYEANLEKQHVYYGTLLAILEMVRGGTTTFADMYFFQDEGARAMLESGIRACPGAVLLGFIPGAMGRIKSGLEWAKNWNGEGNGRIKPTIAPHSLYTCELEHWEAMIAGARDQNLLMHTHVSETRKNRRVGCPPTRRPLCLYRREGSRNHASTRCARRTQPTIEFKTGLRIRPHHRLFAARHYGRLRARWNRLE